MIYEVLEHSPDRIRFVTHPRARRGRGILFATAPFVVYLATTGVLFVLSVQDLSLWEAARRGLAYGAMLAALFALGCFFLGWRIEERIEADAARTRIERRPAIGKKRVEEIRHGDLTAFAIDPSLRSLGADVLFVAVHKDGRRLPIAEGDPHSAQVRLLAADVARLAGVPLEAPKFTSSLA